MTSNKKGLFSGQIFLLILITLVVFSCAVQQRPQAADFDHFGGF